MIAQEIYDLTLTHLRAQNSRSVRVVTYWKREEVESAYRGNDGKKCPAGNLIEDSEYDAKTMEGYTFGSLLALKETPQSLKDKFGSHVELIDALNFIHDWSPPETWEEELSAIASLFKVKYKKAPPPEVKEVTVEEVKTEEVTEEIKEEKK